MKNWIFIAVLALLAACGSPEQSTTDADKVAAEKTESSAPAATPEAPASDEPEITISPEQLDRALGYHVGAFEAKVYDPNKAPSYSNRINISIDRFEGNIMHGHSVVAGNSRPFSGEWKAEDEHTIWAEVREPGDDKYDGVFIMTIDLANQVVKGVWKANDVQLAVIERSYDLPRKEFAYNADQPMVEMTKEDMEEAEYWGAWKEVYGTYDDSSGEEEMITIEVLKHNASNTVLTKEDVENLYKTDLEVIRNTIYARHGYSFKNRKMRYVFDQACDWYIPVSTDVRDELTEIELANIELLKRYEQHAEKYYDYFGR